MNQTKIIFLVFLLSSCSLNNGSIAPGYFQAYEEIKNIFLGNDNEIDPKIISDIPYASMVVKIGNGPSALMILESVSNDEYTWISADGVYFVLKKGKIVKTSGLPNNLYETVSPFVSWQETIRLNKDFTSFLSFRKPELNNLRVSYAYSVEEEIEENLIFEKKKLTKIEERIYSKSVAWEEVNYYWVDDNYFVWKSIQNISPRLPPIYIEVTKKPR